MTWSSLNSMMSRFYHRYPMSRRWLYISLGLLTLTIGAVGMTAYSAYTTDLQPLHPDDPELRILIDRIMSQETWSLTHESWTPAMDALVQLGPKAVPELIETVDKAAEIYIARELGLGSPPSDFSIRSQPFIIQTRFVMVLGRIGDARALPILLYIQAHHDLCPLRCAVDDAIRNIEMRNGDETGSQKVRLSD